MKDETNYLQKARMDIKAVEFASELYKVVKDDDFIYLIAYHTQQAIEKSLKYVLHNLHGVDDSTQPFKTHNIMALINQVHKNTNFVVPHDVEVHADEIFSWEAGTRYDIQTSYNTADLDKNSNMMRNLIEAVKEYALLEFSINANEIINDNDETLNSMLETISSYAEIHKQNDEDLEVDNDLDIDDR